MVAVYEVIDLTKLYPGQTVPANDAVILTVESGEIFGLLGDNGAGKTTLVRQMANLLAPTHGSIRLFGQPLGLAPLYVPGLVGYMPQNGMALNNLTVGETLYFTAHLRGLNRHDAKGERDRLLDLLDLGAARDRLVPKISGGQRRLALLATTIAASPPVLVLDEPTNDLDPVHRRLVWDVIHDLNRAHGTTVILVTHNVIEAERVIQRVGFMRGGRLVALGRPGALKASLNEHLRLELTFPPGVDPALPPAVETREIGPAHWLLVMERGVALAYVAQIETERQVEDFRLSTATLEDLYLALAHETAPAAAPEFA